MRGCYYNEIDASAAAWLRELIRRNLIAPGDVDERSIVDVSPDDLLGYTQCHFFAGIAVWSYALRQAGWPDDRPVWTGSCPCQPFSAAGKGEGYADERHLWPHWHRLISECHPAVCFGEQVDAAIRTGWLDDVCLSLEQIGYAVGAVSFPACSVGAPHIRQRLYFVAQSEFTGVGNCTRPAGEQGRHSMVGRGASLRQGNGAAVRSGATAGSAVVKLGHPSQRGLGIDGCAPRDTGHSDEPELACRLGKPNSMQPEQPSRERARPEDTQSGRPCSELAGPSAANGMGHTDRTSSGDGTIQRSGELGRAAKDARPSATNGFWANAEWIACRDGKSRPVESGSPPLVTGAAARVVRGGDSSAPIDPSNSPEARVMRLRGYGNSINAMQATEFIKAYQEASNDR